MSFKFHPIFQPIDSNGRLFGKVNVIDFSLLATLFLVALGIIAVQSGWHQTSGQVVKGETDILYTVVLRNVQTLKPDLFQPGQKLSMTIRNQPRGSVLITDVKRIPRKMILPNHAGGYQVVDDPLDHHGYDYQITVRDHALITADGYVTEGVKVKIGMSIEVEGFDYRIAGLIANVQEAS